MSPLLVFGVVGGYFVLLFLVSFITSRGADSATFYNAHRRSPWFLVAFGMIGASISGVTFISVPGMVRDVQFSYFQMVLGYLLGYAAIAFILMPVYYRLNLVSIYAYLEERFGKWSHKTGSALFLISRIIGSSFRLYIVAIVLQLAFFNAFDIPFYVTVVVILLLILLYTQKAGIKTIVYTDTLQTIFLIGAVVSSVVIIGKSLDLNLSGLVGAVHKSYYSKVFFWDWSNKHFFLKDFLSGAFIAFVMTGLDQDMMQKNLTCKTLRDAQKNVITLSFTLLIVNLLFLSLGVLLYEYSSFYNLSLPQRSDDVYPWLAINHFGGIVGIIFLIGIIAAAFSSADSALTALTTAFAVDFLGIDINDNSRKNILKRKITHLSMSVIVGIVIIVFEAINDQSVISQIFKVAGYTYGPLLGLFVYGLTLKSKPLDSFVPLVGLLSPVLTYILTKVVEQNTQYRFGYELLMLNGIITFIGLYLLSLFNSEKQQEKST